MKNYTEYLKAAITKWYENAKREYGVFGGFISAEEQGNDLYITWSEDCRKFGMKIGYYKDNSPEQIYNIWMAQDLDVDDLGKDWDAIYDKAEAERKARKAAEQNTAETAKAEPTKSPAKATKKTAAKKSAEKVNRYGVKVGDMFYTSWGYEQTNVNFFQVVELVGTCSVRICEVCPQMVSDNAVSPMASDRAYKLPKAGELLPKRSHATFIEDNERGDLKRVTVSKYNGSVYLNVGKNGHYKDFAYPYNGEELYESWYA